MKSFQILLYILFFAIQNNAQVVDQELNKEDLFLNAKRESLVGRYDKALEILEKLYFDERSNPSINFEMAKIYAQTGDLEKAEKHYRISHENAEENQWILESYIEFLEKQKRDDESIILLKKLITLAPKDKPNYLRLAQKLSGQGRKNEIPELFLKMIEYTGKSLENYNFLLESYIQNDNHTKAIELFDKLIAENPNDIRLLRKKAQYLVEKNQLDAAAELYTRILSINPDDTEANLFQLNKSNGTDQNAYLRALLPIIKNQTIPIDVKVKELIPYVEELAKGHNNDLKEALISVGEQLTLTHPEEAKAWSISGDILINSGSTEAAIKKYEKTIQLNPRNFMVWEQLMYALYELSLYEKLKTVANDATDRFPNQSIGYFFAAKSMMELKEYSKSLIVIDEATNMLSLNDNQLSSFIALKASILSYMGKNDKAKEEFLKSLKLSDEKNPIVYEFMGDVDFSKGDMENAKKNWQKTLYLQPDNKKVKNKLSGI